jgi:hypothetical protein
MKHLKQFESFYYVQNELLDTLLSKWNVDLEDLEDLFIWFSDMGYTVQIRPNWSGDISDKTTAKKCIYVTIFDIDDLNGKEVMEEIRKVIRGLTNLGLYSEPPTLNFLFKMIDMKIVR